MSIDGVGLTYAEQWVAAALIFALALSLWRPRSMMLQQVHTYHGIVDVKLCM